MHLRCTQCSILLLLMNICFLSRIRLWQISQIQSCLCVIVGPGFVSTSPAFMRSSASHPVGPHDRLTPQNTVYIEHPLVGAGSFDTICTEVCNRCDSSIACRMCRLDLRCTCTFIYLNNLNYRRTKSNKY